MHALRTPINALPVEVLSYIITLWAFIDKDGPWSASSLCKHWRGVVLKSPLAWSNITYELRMIDPIPSVWCPYAREQSQDADYVPVEGSKQDRETITTAVCKKRRPFLLWLQRTGEANFSLNIFIENRYPLMETRLFDACYALQSHLPRLRWLAISTEEEFLARTILEMIDLYASRMEGGAMNLQDVRITTRGERLRKQNPQFTSVHDRHLLEILALWRGLHELTLVDLFIGPPFMRGFAASPVGTMPPTVSLCPTLQVLRLEKCDLVPGDELVLLVRSRNGPRSSTLPLDSLDVICCENIAPSHISQLRRIDLIHLSLVAVHD